MTLTQEQHGIAVVLTGLLRSLFSPPVAQTYRIHVAQPLSARLDTFIVVVGESSDRRPQLKLQAAAVYPGASLFVMPLPIFGTLHCPIHGSRVDWGSAHPRDPKASQKLRPPRLEDEGESVKHARRVLIQWYGIRQGYVRVEAAERRRGAQYAWLLRARTDAVHLEPFPGKWLARASRNHVYVPEGGMNAFGVGMCQNDHFFLCPRHLCRPYFHLIGDLWESPFCVDGGRGAREDANVTGSIFARPATTAPGGFVLSEAPSAPFWLPPPPKFADAEWYFLARYSNASGKVCDAGFTTAEACCGLIREVPYKYSIARGDSNRGHVECHERLVYFWRGTNGSAIRERNRDALARCAALYRYPTLVRSATSSTTAPRPSG